MISITKINKNKSSSISNHLSNNHKIPKIKKTRNNSTRNDIFFHAALFRGGITENKKSHEIIHFNQYHANQHMGVLLSHTFYS